MNFIRMAFLLAAVALPARVAAADAQAGQAVFNKSCKTCHGPNGQGNPAIAKALRVAIPDLGSAEVQSKSDDALRKDVVEGKGKMKPVKTISGGEVKNVIAFVRTLAKK